MPDAYEIFAGGSETRVNMLRVGWPELHDALAARVAAAATARVRPCELKAQHADGTRPAASGRPWPNGPAACASCLAVVRPDRPGGYPLDIIDPRGADS